MKKQQIAKLTYKNLNNKYKNYPSTGLKNWQKDWQFLFCVILSARSNDDQVSKITKKLFKKYKTLEDFANINLTVLAQDLNSIGFFNSKARYLQKSSRLLLSKYKGKVPNKLEDLTKLPGVGRKTANVYQGVILGKSEGIGVDTHVARMSKRLKLTNKNTAEKIEQDLMKLFPKSRYHRINPILFWHGRTICLARKPKCYKCRLNHFCPSAFNV